MKQLYILFNLHKFRFDPQDENTQQHSVYSVYSVYLSFSLFCLLLFKKGTRAANPTSFIVANKLNILNCDSFLKMIYFACVRLVLSVQVSAGGRRCACARVTTWRCRTSAASVSLDPPPSPSPATPTARSGSPSSQSQLTVASG